MSKVNIRAKADSDKKRLDRWVNQTNHFGSMTDPIARTSFYRDFNIDRFMLDSMFRYEWVTRRAVEIPAKDATREWITLIHDDPKRVQIAEDELERIDARGKFEEAIILARLYGGNIMVLGAFDGRAPEEPLGVIKQPVLFISNIDRYLAYPQTFYQDAEHPKFGDTEQYLINRPHVRGSDVKLVHETRTIRFDGNYLPPLEKIRNYTYDASILENVFEAIRQFGVANQSGASILEDFITKKLKINNLAQLVSNDDGESMLIKRMGIMAAEMATNNIAVYGEDEDLDKMGTPVSGLDALMNVFIDIVSAAVEIPKSRFFHNQTGRLGGDAGANDLRNHYDNIAAFQKNRLRSKVQRFLDVVLAPLGFEPGEMGFEWKPLWQLSESEQADSRLKVAQTDQIYIQNGVVEPEEVAISRFSQEGINLDDMTIAVKPREQFIAALTAGEGETDPDEITGETDFVEEDGGMSMDSSEKRFVGDGIKTWPEFMKGKMGPLMRKNMKAGKSHSEAHVAAIQEIAKDWKKYKEAQIKTTDD